MNGQLKIDYFLILGAICMVGVAIGQWRIGILIKQLGRQSIISFMFLGVVSIALCMIIFSFVNQLIADPLEITKFKNYCS